MELWLRREYAKEIDFWKTKWKSSQEAVKAWRKFECLLRSMDVA